MLSGKYITLDAIIERVKRDSGFTIEVDKAEIIEWLFDCIGLIGAPMAFIEKATNGDQFQDFNDPILISNYRGELPCDFHTCIACRTYPGGVAMKASTHLFHFSTYNLSTASYAPSAVYDFSAFVSNETTHTTYTYRLNKDYIFTDFEAGMVEMAYLAWPTDDMGYPMVPDDSRFIECAKWFIIEKIATRLKFQNRLAADDFQYIIQQSNWYMSSAGNSARTLNADERESLKCQIQRIIPRSDSHDWHNKYLSEKQWLRNFRTR